MIYNNILTNGSYPTLENNTKSTIGSIENKYEIKVINTDDTSGIEMRNHILDNAETIGDALIIGFDGVTELATTPIIEDSKGLYIVQENGGIYSIIQPEEFYPKRIYYNDDGSFDKTSGRLETGDIHIKLNKFFTLNDDNMIVLKDPRPMEFNMKTYVESGGSHVASATGYQRLALLTQYKFY